MTCDKGVLVDNGDGSYTYTCNFGDQANGTSALINIQMTYLSYDEDEGYYYIEDGEYPQSYAAVEWDYYIGDGDYGGARITYNKTTNILTIDETMTTGSYATIFRTHGISFVSGQKYTIYREYIGGEIVSTTGNNSFVIDTIVKDGDGNPSERNYNDGTFREEDQVSEITINTASQNEADGFKFWIWLGSDATTTFDNYQIRIYVCYDNLLSNWSLSNAGTIPNPVVINNNLTVYSVNNAIADMPAGTKFVRVNNRWFKVEQIRWIVADNSMVATGNNYYTLSQSYKYTDLLTMNIWAYMDNWADYGWEDYESDSMRIISCTEGGGWNIEALNGNIQFAIYDSGVGYNSVSTSKSWSSLSSGWHMFTLTFDGEYARGYLDGQLLNTSGKYSSGKIGYNSTNTIFVGAEAGSSATTPVGQYFKGKIKDLSIENKCLSAEDITNLYLGYFDIPKVNLSEIVDNNGVMTNYTAVSDKVLTVGSVVNDLSAVKEGWTFMKSGNLVSIYSSDYSVTGNNLTISYKANEQSYTLTNKSSSDPYATINQTVSLTEGVK